MFLLKWNWVKVNVMVMILRNTINSSIGLVFFSLNDAVVHSFGWKDTVLRLTFIFYPQVILLDNVFCENQQDKPSKQIVHEIRDYNKRFSGQPRQVSAYVGPGGRQIPFCDSMGNLSARFPGWRFLRNSWHLQQGSASLLVDAQGRCLWARFTCKQVPPQRDTLSWERGKTSGEKYQGQKNRTWDGQAGFQCVHVWTLGSPPPLRFSSESDMKPERNWFLLWVHPNSQVKNQAGLQGKSFIKAQIPVSTGAPQAAKLCKNESQMYRCCTFLAYLT